MGGLFGFPFLVCSLAFLFSLIDLFQFVPVELDTVKVTVPNRSSNAAYTCFDLEVAAYEEEEDNKG